MVGVKLMDGVMIGKGIESVHALNVSIVWVYVAWQWLLVLDGGKMFENIIKIRILQIM